MASMIQRAADKQRAAMYRLFDKHKTSVYQLVYAIVQDEKATDDITVSVFQTAWENISPTMSESAFAEMLKTDAVALCKKHLTRKDPKALRIPQNRRFALSPDFDVDQSGASATEAVRRNLSTMQYTILALRHMSGLSESQQAVSLKLDLNTLHMAWNAQEHNLTFILSNTDYADLSADDVIDEICADAHKRVVPQDVTKRVEAHIRALAAPQEKASRIKVLKLTAIIVVITALTLTLCWTAVLSLRGVEDAVSGDASTDPQTTDTSVGSVTTIENPTHYAQITIKEHGTITVALDANVAPKTVENFKKLADEHFYDSLSFHRIMEGFMMQGGDPKADGTGGSDEEITGEFASNGINNPLSHVRGAISMARANSYDSASSQFFIVHEDSTFLDGDYAAFGFVTDGMDIVDTICTSANPLDDNGTIEIGDQPVIETITVYDAADYVTE